MKKILKQFRRLLCHRKKNKRDENVETEVPLLDDSCPKSPAEETAVVKEQPARASHFAPSRVSRLGSIAEDRPVVLELLPATAAPLDLDNDDTLEIITEDEDFVAEDDPRLKSSQIRTARLVSECKGDIDEMARLLHRVELPSATRPEKERLESLRRKLSEKKRELEASKSETSTLELRMARSRTRLEAFELKRAAKQREIRSVTRAICAAEKVDLAFVVDATGSMASHIASVKNNIKEIVSNIKKTNIDLKMRLGMVAYRDMNDEQRHEILPFTDDVDTFESFVGGIVAKGGGDTPEDIAGGLQCANKLSWQSPTRVVFLIADAPCHGTEFHSMGEGGDSYPSGTPGIDVLEEISRLAGTTCKDGTMSLYFGKINSSTDIMIDRFRSEGVSVETVPMNDISTMKVSVSRGVRSSITKTVSIASGRSSVSFAPLGRLLGSVSATKSSRSSISLKPYTIEERTPSMKEWKEQSAVTVQVYRNVEITSLDEIRKPLRVGIVKEDESEDGSTVAMFMRRAPNPFAEGEIRLAYRGQLSKGISNLDDDENAVILKSYKHTGGGLNDRRQYLKQMEVSTIAFFLANQFNESSVSKSNGCGRITYLPAEVVEDTSYDRESSGNRRFFAEEVLPPGPFIKFSNNTGYWNHDMIDETLLRFTLFTHEISGGYLVLTDLQGVKLGSDYVLTDPAILCKDIVRFGNTNLGERVMKKCVDSTVVVMREKGWTC